MCQFCGVDPAYADFDYIPTEPKTYPGGAPSAPAPVPNFFRLKKKKPQPGVQPIARMINPKLTPQQVESFASALSPGAHVLTAESGQAYRTALRRWSGGAERLAQIVVKPACAEDVSKAILFARGHNLRLTAKCGGHSPDGCSSSEGGLVVDMGLMRSVHVKPDERLVIVGGGALWMDVNKATAEYGLAVVGGTSSHVGVAGVTLHGGYGFLTGEYGLVCDNVVSAEVVTADGVVLTASKVENPDLFWALRGAGNRFGIVTKFVFKAHPQPNEVWAGPLTFPSEKLENVVEALNEWYSKGDPKAAAAMILGKGPDDKPAAIIFCFYNGTTPSALTSFAPLLALSPSTNTAASVPYWRAQKLLDDPPPYSTPDHIRFCSMNLRPPLSPPHIRRCLTHLSKIYDSVPRAGKSGMFVLCVQPDGITKLKKQDTAFPWRDRNFDGVVGMRWTIGGEKDDIEKDEKTREKVVERQEALRKLVIEGGDDFRLYSNHEDHRGPVAREYGVNYGRIGELKRKWDPEGIFMKF